MPHDVAVLDERSIASPMTVPPPVAIPPTAARFCRCEPTSRSGYAQSPCRAVAAPGASIYGRRAEQTSGEVRDE